MVARMVIAFFLAAMLGACAVRPTGPVGDLAPPMTVADFYGFCSTAPTPDGCYSDPICQRYRKELIMAPADLSACLGICRRVYDDLYVANLTNACGNLLDRAEDLCDQFCRRPDRS